MTTCRLRIVPILLLAAACSSGPSAKPQAPAAAGPNPADAQGVTSAFEAYRGALLAQNGVAAADAVTGGTIATYQEYRDLALTGDAATVKSLSMANRMQVLLIRQRVSRAQLEKMDGRALFAHAVDHNWIGKDAIVKTQLADVTTRGPRATAKVTVDGRPTGGLVFFVQEGDRWKLDLGPTLQVTDQVLQQAAKDRKMTENAFLFAVVESLSGRPVTEAIWKPLR